MPDNAPLLEMRDVSRVFVARQGLFGKSARLLAVDNASLFLERGESLGLVGESGCGKSTLGRMACGLLMPTSGQITLEGRSLPPAGAGSWAAGQIQMIFQDPGSSLDPRMSIISSIAEPLFSSGVGRRESLDRAAGLLSLVGLEGAGSRYPHQFSGGQRQRMAIARALVTHPHVIVCDEPVSALDVSVQAQILNLLAEMREKFQPSYLFISHDLAVIGFMCPRILVMYLGQIVEEASRDELFAGPAHPYTRALLEAMPKGAAAWSKGKGIDKLAPRMPGELPSPLNPPSGCHFHPRCVKARPVCSQEAPSWRQIAANWRCRCHFPEA